MQRCAAYLYFAAALFFHSVTCKGLMIFFFSEQLKMLIPASAHFQLVTPYTEDRVMTFEMRAVNSGVYFTFETAQTTAVSKIPHLRQVECLSTFVGILGKDEVFQQFLCINSPHNRKGQHFQHMLFLCLHFEKNASPFC